MDTRKVGVAIIGAGSAGLSARREVELRGADYVLIERGPFGTTCARVGCMPSKLLIAAAEAAHGVSEAHRFGVHVGERRIDGPAVMERVRRERDRFVGFVVELSDSLPATNLMSGSARFVGRNTIEVNGETRIKADAVVIAAGSRPWIPPSLDPVRDEVMVNDDVFEMKDLPESMMVLGTGVIGLEIGQALHRLGVRVAMLNPSKVVGPLTDPVLRSKAVEIFKAEMGIHLGVQELRVSTQTGGGIRVTFTDEHGEHDEHFERVFSAAGRRPNIDSLDLHAAGIETDAHGLPNFDHRTMQVGNHPVFLAGDVNGDRPLLHEAADEGRIAGANAATFPQLLAHTRRTPLAIVFTDPQMATVGARYQELDSDQIVVGEVSYEDQGRARVMGKNKGAVRVYVDRESGILLGAEMLGPQVEHTAHLLAWAIDQRLAVDRVLRMPFYHPVVEEGIRTALRDAAVQLKLAPAPCAHELDCGPGV